MASIIINANFTDYTFALVNARETMKHGNALSTAKEIEKSILDALCEGKDGEDITEFFDSRCKIRLAKKGNTVTGGYIVLDGNLIGLFANGVSGSWLLGQAHKDGAASLDCFDGFLVDFYKRHGWTVDSRVANWTEGEPDVVFMKR